MFFKKRKKNKTKDKPERDNSTHQRVVVVSTKARPRRSGKGRGSLSRQPSTIRYQPPRLPTRRTRELGSQELHPDDYRSYSPAPTRRGERQRSREMERGHHYNVEVPGVNKMMSAQGDVNKRSTPPPAPPLLLKPSVSGSNPAVPRVPEAGFWLQRVSRGKQRVHDVENRSAASRTRSSNDISEWLSWRMKVNDRLSSFVMRLASSGGDNRHRRLPVHDLPSNLTEETLASILSHADSWDQPSTSLDQVSYMIYGVPRVHTGQNKQVKRSKSFRRQKHPAHRPLRRKRSSVREVRPRLNFHDQKPEDNIYRGRRGANNDRHHETSCQEKSLDFSDEYAAWQDEQPDNQENNSSDPEGQISNRRPRLIVREHRVTKERYQEVSPQRLRHQRSWLVPGDHNPGNNMQRTPIRLHDEAPYRPPPNPIGSRQSSFKPPGGVPTILSLYNLPNQSQVPLRHVTTKHKNSKK
ncbi:hypothetical protein LSH36_296g04054 [Paralvinella palmiformis]|uniref:Uncharacterized protein n=1 Tax=Paralvinella palmiformis TaxID=53620 RepID=A0AAD9JJ92_9ANNE|nr:hypothetical protein LSH36_296g04054 [Paralvinella palmiformis]